MTEKKENLRRWRLILGGGEADGIGCGLNGADAGMDAALAALYGGENDAEDGGGKDKTANKS